MLPRVRRPRARLRWTSTHRRSWTRGPKRPLSPSRPTCVSPATKSWCAPPNLTRSTAPSVSRRACARQSLLAGALLKKGHPAINAIHLGGVLTTTLLESHSDLENNGMSTKRYNKNTTRMTCVARPPVTALQILPLKLRTTRCTVRQASPLAQHAKGERDRGHHDLCDRAGEGSRLERRASRRRHREPPRRRRRERLTRARIVFSFATYMERLLWWTMGVACVFWR